MDPAFGWIQPEQLGQAYEFWYKLWDREQDSYDNLSTSNMSHPSHQNPQSSADPYIALDDSELPDYAKGLKRKRDVANRASTAIGMSKFRNRLIGKYEGCPWRVWGKRYSKGIIG